MPRCAAAGRTDVAITSLRGPSVYSTANLAPQIRSIEVYNTSTTALAVAVVRATAVGTVGTALTEVSISHPSYTPVATAANVHTANATVTTPIRQATLGAAAGSGVIWTWGPGEFVLDNVTTSGVVIILPVGSSQTFDFAFEWDE